MESMHALTLDLSHFNHAKLNAKAGSPKATICWLTE